MPILHQWDYLFAFGTIFAALDAYNIGANDVANSFATSVASRSLTLRQACFAAAICEFAGAVLVGARVAGTIKNGIIPLTVFQGNPGVQLLAFTVALTTSASWLMFATYQSWPVSTTYSIVSAVAGVGVALAGKDAVSWGWNNGKGLSTIFAGFLIAPAIAGGFAAIVFLLTKYLVLKRSNSTKAGLIASPVYFFGVAAVLTMSIVYKGAPSLKLNELSQASTAAAIVGSAAVVALLSVIFWLPFVYAKVVKKDYTVRWYHFFIGPLLWRRPAPPDADTIGSDAAVPDYKVAIHDFETHHSSGSTVTPPSEAEAGDVEKAQISSHIATHAPPAPPAEQVDPHPIEGPWVLPKNLWIIVRYKIPGILTHGTTVDVLKLQAGESSAEAARLNAMHTRVTQYDNSTEHLYSFLQVMTACTASFAHGSNDVANAVGAYAVIYDVWSNGAVAGKDTPVPVWILVYGGAMIVIGLATYGYNIMRVIGNRLTLHSPSRGFSMELGSAITVILASNYGLPVSTTMCIVGATLGVALCNGDWRTFNWRGLGWIFLGWVLTVPVVGVAAGCLMGIILNAPHF
ncbi:hypothetical protein M408DRAFT_28932 [Serendipita vermifera MAFF 305830]|uniref:Phosphate transporter n=1 Tax=Serendipita vermifera MAFF 305830 TaxID=933852 RepID=A0A0C2WY21_SERVB|nr:hypothetical protein M408DRAFT_28932 [Serendipita vermifera MAFF 305830]